MSFSISTRHLKCISGYEQAKAVWDSAMPWKHEDATWRPLAERRARHKRLVKVVHGGVEGYACVLYSTALVTYYADGTVILQNYDSISSRAFTRYVHPPLCSMGIKANLSYWSVVTDEGTHYYSDHGPIHLARTKSGNWRLLSKLEPRKEWISVTPKIRAVNRQLKAYETWLEMTTRLTGVPPMRKLWGSLSRDDIQQILAAQPEAFMKARDFGVSIDHIKIRAHELTGARFVRPVPFIQPIKVPA